MCFNSNLRLFVLILRMFSSELNVLINLGSGISISLLSYEIQLQGVKQITQSFQLLITFLFDNQIFFLSLQMFVYFSHYFNSISKLLYYFH